MSVRHIVILHFKKSFDVNYAELMESTRSFIENMPGITKYYIYENESRYTPDDVVSIGVQINFEDDQALQDFMDNPKHYEANTIFEKYLADPPYMVLTHHV
jgi:heme-degrading monooxygenase HmoA